MSEINSVLMPDQDQRAALMFLTSTSTSMRSASSCHFSTSYGRETSDPSELGSSSPHSPGSRSPHSPVTYQDTLGRMSHATDWGIRTEESSVQEVYPAATHRRASLALLLEASAAAAAAERKAELLASAAKRICSSTDTDKFVTETIHRAQTRPRIERSHELKPLDRRVLAIDASWSRLAQIERDPQLLSECRRLVRGTQGCGRECESKFTNLIEFAKHVDSAHDIHFRPFLCPKEICPWAIIGFHERSECTRHIRTKHHKAMYSCSIDGCRKTYNRSDAFRRHVRQAHSNPSSRFNRLRRPSSAKDDGDSTDSESESPSMP